MVVFMHTLHSLINQQPLFTGWIHCDLHSTLNPRTLVVLVLMVVIKMKPNDFTMSYLRFTNPRCLNRQLSSQGPSASAYVTYQRPEDTLRAIQAVNNIQVDGRTLKASLGTTKYCSHFLKGSQCPKPVSDYMSISTIPVINWCCNSGANHQMCGRPQLKK